MSGDNRRKNISIELRESGGRMNAARRLAADPDTRKDAVGRAYYAAFHAVRAALLTRGLEPKSHRGVRETFRAQFTGPDMLPIDLAAALDRLESARMGADYAAGRDFSDDETNRLLADAEAVIAGVREFLTVGAWLTEA